LTVRRRRPGREQPRLGIGERALPSLVPRLSDGGFLDPHAGLQRVLGARLPGGVREDLPAQLLDPDVGRRKRGRRAVLGEGGFLVAVVIGDLAAALDREGWGGRIL